MDHALRHRAQNADVRSGTPLIPARAPAELVERLRQAAAVEDPQPDEA
jgi:chorismate synthase